MRLDESDHAALQQQADQLRLRPGTLARILVLAGLNRYTPVTRNQAARSALDRLVQRSQQGCRSMRSLWWPRPRGIGLPVKLVT